MATAQRVHIAYDDVGAGEPAVVFVHGLFENRTYYAAQVHYLRRSHRIVNIDLRGHGESEVPDSGYTIDVFADDVIQVCDQAGLTRAVFCGHSFALALQVAIRRPDLAAGVVLLDGAVLIPPGERDRLMGFAEVLETDAWREALLGFFGGVAAGAAERVRADIAVTPRFDAAPLFREIAESDYADELLSARCPILYVHSGMPIDLQRLRAVRPDATVLSVANAGHYVMLTQPVAVNAALDRFLINIPDEGGKAMPTELKHCYDILIQATPEKIWDAITMSEYTTRYFPATSVESDWRTGSHYAQKRPDGTVAFEGRVVDADPPRRLVETVHFKEFPDWRGHDEFILRWDIEPMGDACRVTLTHQGPESVGKLFDKVTPTCPLVLSGMKTLLETGKPLSVGKAVPTGG
jgi:pimeloyl-ACP methyl ester carboxylesterase/uncharacterized protein YndB with AHSA1/START domain